MSNKDLDQHEHFWDTPSTDFDVNPVDGKKHRVIGDCACGERLFETDL